MLFSVIKSTNQTPLGRQSERDFNWRAASLMPVHHHQSLGRGYWLLRQLTLMNVSLTQQLLHAVCFYSGLLRLNLFWPENCDTIAARHLSVHTDACLWVNTHTQTHTPASLRRLSGSESPVCFNRASTGSAATSVVVLVEFWWSVHCDKPFSKPSIIHSHETHFHATCV